MREKKNKLLPTTTLSETHLLISVKDEKQRMQCLLVR